MKRCKFCARTGTVMLYLPRDKFGYPSRNDEYACHDRQACKRRAEQLGKWVGTRVIRRHDSDGTRWTILRHDQAARHGLAGGAAGGPWDSGFVLMCEYRQHRVLSWHPTVEAAKDHRDDIVRSWESRSMREYAGGRR